MGHVGILDGIATLIYEINLAVHTADPHTDSAEHIVKTLPK